MELLALVAMVAFVGMVAGTGKMMRPETAAQRRREWSEAADEDRHMHRITQDVYKRMDKRHKRAKYKPNRARIARRVKERRSE